MFRRIDVILGLVTHMLGIIAFALAVFGPATFSYGSNWLDAGSVSLWNQGLDLGVVIYLVALLLATLAVVAGAYLRSQGSEAEGATVLLISTMALLVGTAITIPGSTTAIVPAELHTDTPDSVGIGIYFVPAVMMAIVTTVTSMALHYRSDRPVATRPH